MLTRSLIFLDIKMPGKNGFELIHELANINIKATVIFTTAYVQYSIDAIRHAAFDYLLKPINPLELKKTLIRYKNAIEAENTGNNEKENNLTAFSSVRED